MDEIWNSVLAEIEVQVSKPQYITFFKVSSLVSIEGNVATIASPTPMTSDYIERRYYSLIKQALDKRTGENNSLVFTIKKIVRDETPETGPLFQVPQKPKTHEVRPLRIREDYTFDNLAVSESNQLAYTAASAVALEPGVKYNPLYLYGTVGVGKTHLMNAIANDLFEKNPRAKILYMTTEEFTNEIVESIQGKQTTQMRKKFRNVDLLLLDDIQFLSGKEKVQEELFHTFNTLIDQKKQVVFSSDRAPQDIKNLQSRLISRLEGGLNIDIQAPDFELRTAILLIKAEKYGLNLPVELAKLASEKIDDARALEGFILKLSGLMASSSSFEITEDLVNKAVGIKTSESKRLHPDDVINTICNYFDIKPTQLKGTKRTASLVKARHLCMYLLKEELKLTYSDIGNILGGRDHTTVMHGVDKIKIASSNAENNNEDIVFISKLIKESSAQ